jgi:hypothetical protein
MVPFHVLLVSPVMRQVQKRKDAKAARANGRPSFLAGYDVTRRRVTTANPQVNACALPVAVHCDKP